MIDLRTLDGTLWLAEPTHLAKWHEELEQHRLAGNWPTPVQLQEAKELAGKQLRKVAGKIGILSLSGVVEYRMSAMGYFFGGISLEEAGYVLQHFAGDKSIGAIVLQIDSPGGGGYGLPEFASQVMKTRDVKPVYAIADAMMCSAAYWIGSAASKLYAVPSGDVGNIGVYQIHLDVSQALEQEGLKVTVKRAGKYKSEWAPYHPLTPEAGEFMQEGVDELYTEFLQAVAKYRGVSVTEVRNKYGQGRSLSAKKALEAGMVDGIMTMNELLERLTGGQAMPSARAAKAEAELLRLRHDQRKRKETVAV